MRSIKSIVFFMCLVCLAVTAEAQSAVSVEKSGDRYSGRSVINGTSRSSGVIKADSRSLPSGYATYKDDGLKDLEKNISERDWNSESTAWQRASALNTKEAYQKYIARYPSGVHIPEARKRLIDAQVNDVFSGSHDNLPGMNHVDRDDKSPTSTVTVENTTQFPLTVMYSGAESKSVVIDPYSKSSVTLKNGSYRIAASVPAPNVRPFAGTQSLTGGRYETGYCIVPDFR